MIDVFFRGYGAWYETIYHRHYDEYGNEDDAPDEDAEQLTTNQQVSGVFSLFPDDEVAYKHTKNFDGVKVLMESTHQDRHSSGDILLLSIPIPTILLNVLYRQLDFIVYIKNVFLNTF